MSGDWLIDDWQNYSQQAPLFLSNQIILSKTRHCFWVYKSFFVLWKPQEKCHLFLLYGSEYRHHYYISDMLQLTSKQSRKVKGTMVMKQNLYIYIYTHTEESIYYKCAMMVFDLVNYWIMSIIMSRSINISCFHQYILTGLFPTLNMWPLVIMGSGE